MANALFRAPPPFNEPVKTYLPHSPERAELKLELKRQGAAQIEVPLVIAGQHRHSNVTAPMIVPHRHAHQLGVAHQATARDVEDAIGSAVTAQKSWSQLPWEERASVFLKAADLLSGKYRQVMNAATMLGQSKTCYQAEIDAACELADFWRFNVHFLTEIYQDQPLSVAGVWNRTASRGLEGFVFAVSPFNFTSIALNLATAPALMGSAVVWKPGLTSMLSSWVGMQIHEEAGLPAGVVNMVSGDHTVIGPAALKHRDLGGVHFTGSTPVFNHMWQTIGQNIANYRTYPRIVGETGGKDFVFAHPSADVTALVTALIRGAFEYQGQKCSAASRAYIPRSLWSQVEERLVAEVKKISVGDPEDFTNFMGAVIDAKAYQRLKQAIEQAKSDPGVRLLVGGECDDRVGYFIKPTILVADQPDYHTMKHELFGPILTIYVYEDSQFERTLAICDQTSPYALTGAIFARDRGVVHLMTEALANAAGNFYINDKPTGAVVGQQPFGGARSSGTNDKAGSKLNLLRWMSQRTIKETFAPALSVPYPFMAAP